MLLMSSVSQNDWVYGHVTSDDILQDMFGVWFKSMRVNITNADLCEDPDWKDHHSRGRII